MENLVLKLPRLVAASQRLQEYGPGLAGNEKLTSSTTLQILYNISYRNTGSKFEGAQGYG